MERNLEYQFIAELTALNNATVDARICANILNADDFEDDYCAKCWTAVKSLLNDKQEVTIVNFLTAITKEGLQMRSEIIGGTCLANVPMMAVTIHEKAVKRRLLNGLLEVAKDLEEPTSTSADAVARLTEAMKEAGQSNSRQLTAWNDLYKRVLEELQERANGQAPTGVPTGYSIIDEEGALGEGSLVIVAGRTSNGKTAFALNVALNVARLGVPVVVYSLEMTNMQVGSRLLSNISQVPQRALKTGQLNEGQWQSVVSCGEDLPIYFDDGRANGKEAIFNAIRNTVEQKNVRVVFIDYLQLVKGTARDRRTDIGDIANELKVLAVQLKITIVLLSQLAREAKGMQPVPRISELKESGEIENAADAVYLVYRPEQHGADIPFPDMSRRWSDYDTRGNALIICAKNRNGQTGEQLLGFDGDTSRFFQRDQYELRTTTDSNTFTRLC